MADNKKGFILYADLIHTVSVLPREIKGDLFQLILDYVNDKNPEPTDILLKVAFNPIKLQLKRDLNIWESKIKQRSEAGKKSAESRSTKSTTVESRSTNPTVIVNDTVNATDTVNVKVTVKENIDSRKLKFASTLEHFLPTYGKSLLNEFFKYWTEPNKSGTKFRQELEKTWDLSRRLETWAKNEKNFNKGKANFDNHVEIVMTQREKDFEEFKRKQHGNSSTTSMLD